MRAKNKLTKIAANAFLALSMIAGVVGFTTLQARAEGRAYEPYAVSFGGSDIPDKELRKQYITQCYLQAKWYGSDNGYNGTWHYFSDTYCKNGVGYQLRNRSDLKVEPTFAGSPNAGIGDPTILIGGLTAQLVNETNDVKKLHIEGKYELNLYNIWTTDEKTATGRFDPGAAQVSEDYQKWVNQFRTASYKNLNKDIGDPWGLGDNTRHFYYYPRMYFIQLVINNRTYKVPLQLPNNSMVYDPDAILNYNEDIFAGSFSQDIYLPNNDNWDKGQTTLSKNPALQMKEKDLKKVVIDWVLSTNTKCGIAVPLDGTVADCSKHYIEDIGLSYINNHNYDGDADYEFYFITNCLNENQLYTYEYDLQYTLNGKTYVKELQAQFSYGERKQNLERVTLPKGASDFIVKNVYSGYTGETDTYRYRVQDFRIALQDTDRDGIVKVDSADGKTSTITVNIERQYKINYDVMRGAFDREYPNIAGGATEALRKSMFTAGFEYVMKDPNTGERKKYYKGEHVYLKDKTGTFNLSVDFPGDVEKITFNGVSAPDPYDLDWYGGKVLYRNTDGLPKPTEFSADVIGTTRTYDTLKTRDLFLRIDYASPNAHKYALQMKYYDGETEHDVLDNGGVKQPSFVAKEGYHSYGWGGTLAKYGDVEYGNTNQPLQSVPKTSKYIKITGFKDLDDGTVYDYEKYIYCEHKYDNDCDDECNWCGRFRATDEHKYEWVIDKEPTAKEEGIKHEECKICGKKKEPVYFPALGSGDDTKAGKDGKGANGGEDAKDGNGAKDGKDAKDGKGANDGKDVKDGKGTNDGKGSAGDIIKGNDGTLVGSGANIAAVDHAILGNKSEEDPAGAVFGKLQLKAKKTTKKSIKLSWKKISGCKYVVYGTKCGGKYKKLARTNKNTYTMKGLKKGQYYKFIVVALKDGKVVSTSKSVHAATKGKKVGNYKLVKLNKTKITLKKNKTFKLKAKQIKDSKQIKVRKHRALKYESSNTKVVKVTVKGKIKAVGKGTAYVYAYSQNGVFNKIKVKVK